MPITFPLLFSRKQTFSLKKKKSQSKNFLITTNNKNFKENNVINMLVPIRMSYKSCMLFFPFWVRNTISVPHNFF